VSIVAKAAAGKSAVVLDKDFNEVARPTLSAGTTPLSLERGLYAIRVDGGADLKLFQVTGGREPVDVELR
jgi:Flp pilus assembly protein protease CpaA